MIEPLVGQHSENHPDVTEEGCDYDAFGNDQFQYGPRTCSDRLTDPELVSPLLDRDQHDVGDPHDSAQQRQDSDDPECCADHRHSFVHLHIHCQDIPYSHRTFVIRRRVVVFVQRCAQPILERPVLLLGVQPVERESIFINLLASVVDCPDGADRRVEA